MKEFFLENWKFLLEILLLVISTVIVIVKKTAKVKVRVPESALASMLGNIPVWIVDAENQFGSGNGDKKFSYVYNKAVLYLAEKVGVPVNYLPSTLFLSIKDFIEAVLAAPQKKEEVHEER